jgi:hypothetical protein
MQLQKELLPNFKTANEGVNENVHTYAPFHIYCESKEKEKSKKYFDEEFNLTECRYDIFGPDNHCDDCSGTGWVPCSKANMDEPLCSLWVQAETDVPSQDGFHLVPCPKCDPLPTVNGVPELDEHIVKQGSSFELKSKKTGKNLGKYKSKAGAVKRERQVEYFKHLHEDENGTLKGTDNGKPLPWRLHEDEVLPGHPPDTGHSNYHPKNNQKDVNEDKLPSEYNKTKSQAEKDEKKKSDAEKMAKDPNASKENKQEREKQVRQAKEKERQSKKLLPYEFTDQKDAELAGKHLGINGAHATGNGIYKPGSSDFSLRDAVARKKSKQRMRGGFHEDRDFDKGSSALRGDSHDAYALDKANCHEDRDYMHDEDPKPEGNKLPEMVKAIKESVHRQIYSW